MAAALWRWWWCATLTAGVVRALSGVGPPGATRTLRSRIEEVAAAESVERQMYETRRGRLPVVALDAMLPSQRLDVQAADPAFRDFATKLGLGGLFAMVSVCPKRRKLRRHGVLCKLDGLVAPEDETPKILMSVRLVAGARCVVRGPRRMVAARWRRAYGADGNPAMGWGPETFVDDDDDDATCPEDGDTTTSPPRLAVDVLSSSEEEDDEPTLVDAAARAERLVRRVERWRELVLDDATYARPGFRAAVRDAAEAAAVLKAVDRAVGPMPAPSAPSAWALWCAAVVNPLPPLGVSVELRGNLLENFSNTTRRFDILERGLERSIAHLEGRDYTSSER